MKMDAQAEARTGASDECRAILQHIAAYLDGELDATECRRIDAHCAGCPDCLAVVGGLLFSQLLTLCVTPVFYVYVEELRERLRRRSSRSAMPAREATA